MRSDTIDFLQELIADGERDIRRLHDRAAEERRMADQHDIQANALSGRMTDIRRILEAEQAK